MKKQIVVTLDDKNSVGLGFGGDCSALDTTTAIGALQKAILMLWDLDRQTTALAKAKEQEGRIVPASGPLPPRFPEFPNGR